MRSSKLLRLCLCAVMCIAAGQLLKADGLRLPASEIRVGILSKYHLTKCTIHVDDGKLFLNGTSQPLTDAEISVEQTGRTVNISGYKNIQYLAALTILSEKPFSISFESNGTKITRTYAGSLAVEARGSELMFICTIPAEMYIHAAALSELGDLVGRHDPGSTKNWSVQCISAMEIAVRSYLFCNLSRHSKDGYDVCDLTHCIHFEKINISNTASLTPGLVMTDGKNSIIEGFFHSSCGGTLSTPAVFWENSTAHKKFYRSGRDSEWYSLYAHCSVSPNSLWTAKIKKNIMAGFLGVKRADDVRAQYAEGRVTSISFSDETHARRTISAAKFLSLSGKALGWNVLKSNNFTVEEKNGEYIFQGKGLGHGIGLCQWGAYHLTESHGWSWRDVIKFYYNNPVIVKGIYQ